MEALEDVVVMLEMCLQVDAGLYSPLEAVFFSSLSLYTDSRILRRSEQPVASLSNC